MEQIFLRIIQHVAQEMPQLSLIDEDYGQLETDQDTYPVTFPCVLVGNIDTDWEERTNTSQRGFSVINLKLAIDCYDDTHIGSGTEENIIRRRLMAHNLFHALNHYKPIEQMTPLVRTKSHDYTAPHGIKVYQQTYTFRQTEEEEE